jgi:hypothetical protein
MVNVTRLKCILFGGVIGFVVSMYFINLVAVCCNTSEEASHGSYCVVCITSEPKHKTVIHSDPPILHAEKNRPSQNGYLKFFDEKTFQRTKDICPSSICEDGPCVPIHLKVVMIWNRILVYTDTA